MKTTNKQKTGWTFYIVWGDNPGPEKFQFQVSRTEPYVFRFVVFNFGICILRNDVEMYLEMYEKHTIKLQEALYELVFAYTNKDEDFPHTFEIEAIKEAVNLVRDKDKKFVQEVFEAMRK